MTWFYESNGAQKGPVSDADLDRLILEGQILPTTLVWREGQAAWAPLQQARPGGPTSASPAAAGTVQCDSCGRFFDPSDVIDISGHRICGGCKPQVLQRLQQGGALPELYDPQRTGPAWEHRETLGWFPAARDTAIAVLTQPTATFQTMRVHGGLTNPFWYNMLTGGIGSMVFGLYVGLAEHFFSASLPRSSQVLATGSFFGFMLIFRIISSIVSVAIAGFIYGGILHVCLMICGGAKRDFETTYRAYCYGAGSVTLLHLIPGIGTLVAIPWGLIVTCISLSKSHETDLWRAVVALFLPSIICCGLILLVVLAVMGAGVASRGIH